MCTYMDTFNLSTERTQNQSLYPIAMSIYSIKVLGFKSHSLLQKAGIPKRMAGFTLDAEQACDKPGSSSV